MFSYEGANRGLKWLVEDLDFVVNMSDEVTTARDELDGQKKELDKQLQAPQIAKGGGCKTTTL